MPLCILATVPPQRAMKATTTMYRTGTQDRTLCFTTVAAFGLTLDCLQLRLNELWTPQSCKGSIQHDYITWSKPGTQQCMGGVCVCVCVCVSCVSWGGAVVCVVCLLCVCCVCPVCVSCVSCAWVMCLGCVCVGCVFRSEEDKNRAWVTPSEVGSHTSCHKRSPSSARGPSGLGGTAGPEEGGRPCSDPMARGGRAQRARVLASAAPVAGSAVRKGSLCSPGSFNHLSRPSSMTLDGAETPRRPSEFPGWPAGLRVRN